MKIVINTSYGGITDESAKLRKDPKFIEDVETGRFVGRVLEDVPFGFGYAETLAVVEIPDNATDMMIVDYDGIEGIIYVCDGMMFCVTAPGCEVFQRIIGK